MRKLLSAFASNVVFANIMIFLLFFLGIVATQLMRREMFPEMSLDIISVGVAYPGADPEEVEEGILRKIEDVLQGESGIKELQTIANENVGTAVITVEESADTQKVLDRVTSKINSISTFPVDAENPVITELLLKDPVMILSLSGDMSERRLKEWAEKVKEDLLQVEAITIVEIFGAREYEISIEVSEERLREHQLSLNQVVQQIRAHNLNVPGGLIRSDTEVVRIRTMGRKYTGEEISEIPLISNADGRTITLGMVADVIDGFTEESVRPGIAGAPALFLYVKKTSQQDAIDISEATLNFIEEQQYLLPENIHLGLIYDATEMLRARINLLVKNGVIGLILVFFLLWIFLDLRLSFWAGMGMPISIAGALVILWAVGGSLNMISLFGLIMVLGIIVDDAIVVGEAIYHHQQQPGADPYTAAVRGVSEVGMPVLGAVLTTILAFIPLMFVGGIMGKFISILPVVVIACLVVSLYECLFLLPAHLGVHLPSERKDDSRVRRFFNTLHEHTGKRLERFAAGPYQRFLNLSLSWRYVALSIAIGILIVTFGAVVSGRIRTQMFPSFDSFMLTAVVEFPNGTPIAETEKALDQIDAATRRLNEQIETHSGLPAIQKTLRLAGQNLNDPYSATAENIGSVQIILTESTDRDLGSEEIMTLWENEIGFIAGAEAVSVEELNAGPPGKPIDVRIKGSDLEEMRAVSEELKMILASFPGTSQIQSDMRPGKNEIRFTLKPEAVNLGLSVAELGNQLNQAYYGGEALRLQRGRDEVKIMVRNTYAERSQLTDLEKMRIRTADGREVPLLAVADMETSPGFAKITRIDGLRAIGVSCNVDNKQTSSSIIIAELEKKIFPMLLQKYPDVYLEFQGQQKDSAESVSSLLIGFPIALIGIYVIIATIFRSYVQPLIIMVTVPFGIIGAVLGHLFRGVDLSLMSMFGIVALAGVVVNDAIVLIESFNHHIQEGLSVKEALHEAGKRRFRAVFLTTLSTVGGLTPLILEKDLQAQFLIPMALSIAAGVAFATLLTLLLIPSLILILSDLRVGWHYLKYGKLPESRAVLEPARLRK
ncbi:efflux RND transporter permease subunit [Kiritimatiellota bacterium B12222]|nr:efflux RND transporter permease subunit [Kiritimatiellota bacterium B12222]